MKAGVAIQVRDLRKAYNGTPVLRGIDLDIDGGETLVIVGGSGQGKSVLLRHLAGLEPPDGGSVHLNGLALADYLALDPKAKPFRTAMVFQGAALLNSLSVADNVALRLLEHERRPRKEIVDVVKRCLELVDLTGSEDKLPADLSGGMRKRVAIARAMASQPQVIFHDEPTADLDPILTRHIGELIRRIQSARGATQVVVTHDLVLATTVGDRIAVIQHGKIVELLPAHSLAGGSHPYTREFVRAASLQV